MISSSLDELQPTIYIYLKDKTEPYSDGWFLQRQIDNYNWHVKEIERRIFELRAELKHTLSLYHEELNEAYAKELNKSLVKFEYNLKVEDVPDASIRSKYLPKINHLEQLEDFYKKKHGSIRQLLVDAMTNFARDIDYRKRCELIDDVVDRKIIMGMELNYKDYD